MRNASKMTKFLDKMTNSKANGMKSIANGTKLINVVHSYILPDFLVYT